MRVRKTYKNWIGGQWTRGESGQLQAVQTPEGTVQTPQSSRKDLRAAVEAARGAQPGWAALSGYGRGQILYRAAEMLDARRGELEGLLGLEGWSLRGAQQEVADATERLLLLAGWCDKWSACLSAVQPVSGPFYVASSPRPLGVVVSLTPSDGGLTSALTRWGAALLTGNSLVAVCEQGRLSRLTLGEILAASDLPAGTANLLSGPVAELAAWSASHRGVQGLDLGDHPADPELWEASAQHLQRVLRSAPDWGDPACVGPQQLAAWSELCTVWHPLGY